MEGGDLVIDIRIGAAGFDQHNLVPGAGEIGGERTAAGPGTDDDVFDRCRGGDGDAGDGQILRAGAAGQRGGHAGRGVPNAAGQGTSGRKRALVSRRRLRGRYAGLGSTVRRSSGMR